MTPASRGYGPAVLLVVGLSCVSALFPTVAGDGEPLPYRLFVEVSFGEPLGPESLRNALEAELSAALGSARCFLFVGRSAPKQAEPNDLQLLVVLDEYKQETEFDVSIAQRSSPWADPEHARRMVARVEALVQIEVRTLPDSAPIRSRRFRQRSSWRPFYEEDPRHEARLRMIEEVVRISQSFVCKGSPKKWDKQLRQARSGAGEPTSKR